MARGERRRQELVNVAEEVFFESGFLDATMQQVAARAGASKETLYRHFGSKDELLAEAMTARTRRLIVPLDAVLQSGDAVGEVLRAFGTRLLEMMMHPNVVALLRAVVAETPRRPALGQIFYELGPERTRSNLTEYLDGAHRRGEMRVPNPRLAATIFLGAVMSYSHAAGLVLVDLPPLSRGEVVERVDEVVTVFLQRYG